MKNKMIIKNLDKALKSIKGDDIYLTKDKPLTKEIAIISCCEFFKGKKPGDSLKAYAIGLKINNKKEVELTSDEVELLKVVIESNEIFATIITGALLNELTTL